MLPDFCGTAGLFIFYPYNLSDICTILPSNELISFMSGLWTYLCLTEMTLQKISLAHHKQLPLKILGQLLG